MPAYQDAGLAYQSAGFAYQDGATLVEVPDVVGDLQAAGTAELEGENFVVAVATAYSSTVLIGVIISQSPTGGSMVPDGSTVTITVSLGPQPQSQASTGGWLFLNEYAAHKQRKLARERLQKRLEEETESIPNTTDREIAEFFRHQERVEAKRAELDELAELVKGNDDLEEARQYSEEVAKAYVQAFMTGSREALAQLDRELAQALEDEEFLLMVLVAMN